jgi:hypothetical protein
VGANEKLTKIFTNFLEEYVIPARRFSANYDTQVMAEYKTEKIDRNKEQALVENFLVTPCSCGKNCQDQFSKEELIDSRDDFRSLTRSQRGCSILAQLRSFQRSSDQVKSARMTQKRTRQKFDYRINADRFICRDVFVFYHGISLRRLKYLQKHLINVGTSPPMHGNAGRIPKHACSIADKLAVETFIVNFAAIHGLPDPGRDLRIGKGKLKILLPAVLNYRSIHRIYKKSTDYKSVKIVGYRAFIRIWQETAPYICFSKPRSDLCMTCEDFKKSINQITSDLKECRENEKIKLHQQAIEHLENAKKERDLYRQRIQITEDNYLMLSPHQQKTPCKPNSQNISMHYSWDFAQQLHYPYEDQQVGPIYFKTPRRAQLFGVCCEAIPRQINYLIDEADFYDKGSNTVISLLDHFFEAHGFGEKHAYLTADNCVGQNKNNAVLHYLIYRTLVGLHNNIDLSFMLVGHTKFGPDGNYGIIKYRYRRSKIYTYDQLAETIEKSSKNGINICQRYRNDVGIVNFKYRDWSGWLSKYFKKLPNITKYHHFSISSQRPGVVVVKKSVDGPEEEYNLLKITEFPHSSHKMSYLPQQLNPPGLSAERAWYLYDNIRGHIPLECDKDATCPLPSIPRNNKGES